MVSQNITFMYHKKSYFLKAKRQWKTMREGAGLQIAVDDKSVRGSLNKK